MRRTDAEPARAEQSGFSLIETLIAAALLMLVALGVLPLFSNSIVSNVQGNLASLSANFAREEAERLIQLQFNDPELTPTSGTELESIFHYSESEERWVPDADWAGTETELYAMTTRIRQFSRAAIDNDAGDYEFEDAEVQPASASADDIHFKEIRVTVQSQPGFGGGKTTTILLYKGL